jgi:hypothetical protein
MPRKPGRPKDTPARRRQRTKRKAKFLEQRNAAAQHLRKVAKRAADLLKRVKIPRRSLRLEWLQDNSHLIAAGQEPFYQFVLFGEQGYNLVNPPQDGYSIIVN